MVSFSVLIVTHGREELLQKCLDSLQLGIQNEQLIILANGKELSPEILAKAEALTPNFILLQSDILLTPGKARNLAMQSVQGKWIFFLDDDAFLLPGYWDVALPLMQEPKIDVFGGPDTPASGMNAVSMSLALALSSPFCTGATFSRHKPVGNKLLAVNEEKLTSCNLWVRVSALEGVSFPEDYLRAEETVFLQKLQKNGKSLYYHPKLKVGHFRRSKINQLWKPTFRAGYFRSKLMREKLTAGDKAFWLPAIFVLLHLFLFIDPLVFWYLGRMYASIILFLSISLAMRVRRMHLFPLVAFMHYFVVFMYGIGFLSERVGRIRK